MRLTLEESIPLVHALVADAAENAGVRALFIKGVSLTWHGLREPRVPADVDVMLPPGDVTALLTELAKAGWRPRLKEFNDFPFPHHSVTLIHDHWPCDIDVHRRFPGFLRDADHAFDSLWSSHELMPVAGQRVAITSFAASALVMALHSARSTPDNPRHARELTHLFRLAPTWTDTQRREIGRTATATGAAKALESVLPRLGVEVNIREEFVDDVALKTWQLRVEGRAHSGATWLKHVAAGSPSQWPARIRDALWPREELFRLSRPVPPGRRALNRARLQRLGRGVRSVPGAVLAMSGRRRPNVIDATL